MREVPDGFVAAIKENRVSVCELYEFTLRNGKSYYYTNHGDDLDWGNPSKRYYFAPIQRSAINSSMNLEVDTVELRLSDITSELYDAVKSNQLEGITVVIKRALYDQNSASGMEFTIFVGTGAAKFNRNELIISFSSILNSLNVKVPKNCFQQPCNYTLFDEGCTLDRDTYKESSSATSDANNDYSIVDATFVPPEGDTSKYNNGEIVITSGDYIGERRSILLSESGLFVVSVPFPGIIESGTTFDYWAGCDYTPETCRDRFSNEENFYGFVYLPAPEESM
jgi:uncharacterized phage protein (TIGR02218 family)